MKNRRDFLKHIAVTPLILGSSSLMALSQKDAPISKNRLQYSINAYSFNTELRNGDMTFFDMMEFCAEIGMDAVDITGTPDINTRQSDIALIKNWLEASSKLGATIMRVFTGKNKSETHSTDQIKEWLIKDFKTCAQYGEAHGVIVGHMQTIGL